MAAAAGAPQPPPPPGGGLGGPAGHGNDDDMWETFHNNVTDTDQRRPSAKQLREVLHDKSLQELEGATVRIGEQDVKYVSLCSHCGQHAGKRVVDMLGKATYMCGRCYVDTVQSVVNEQRYRKVSNEAPEHLYPFHTPPYYFTFPPGTPDIIRKTLNAREIGAKPRINKPPAYMSLERGTRAQQEAMREEEREQKLKEEAESRKRKSPPPP